ncbi:hypothetical protein Y032_0051g2125 [Ancylostoma ceylanicum]|uniref:Uncharacterized protein n=1 Tax=Ancylostoma ceylanicum TaxID=53326 RepID=A0A016U8U8_9BILA|nr:hypothetical protein Y032_0051g2125 [Ancylostoma ceylanicum]
MPPGSILGVQGIFALSYSMQNFIDASFQYCYISFPYMIWNFQVLGNIREKFSNPNFYNGYMETIHGFSLGWKNQF